MAGESALVKGENRMSKLIMEFNIRIKGEEVSAMNSPRVE